MTKLTETELNEIAHKNYVYTYGYNIFRCMKGACNEAVKRALEDAAEQLKNTEVFDNSRSKLILSLIEKHTIK